MSSTKGLGRFIVNVILSIFLFAGALYSRDWADEILMFLVSYIVLIVIFNSFCNFLEKNNKNNKKN